MHEKHRMKFYGTFRGKWVVFKCEGCSHKDAYRRKGLYKMLVHKKPFRFWYRFML